MSLKKTIIQTGIFGSFKLLSQLLSFVAFLVFARLVGAHEFGIYTYIISVTVLLQPFSDLGMLYEVSRRSKSRTLRFLEKFFSTFVLLDLAVSLLVGLVVLIKGYSVMLAFLASLVFIASNLFRFFSRTHMVWGRARFLSIVMFLDRMIFAGLVLVLPKRTEFLLLSVIAAYFFSAFYLFKNVKFKPKPGYSFKYFSLPFFIALMFQIAAERVPMLVYDARFGLTDLGKFGLAFIIFQGLQRLVTDMGLFVTMRGGEFKKRQFEQMKVILLFLASMTTVAVFIFQPLLIHIGNLVFGVGYGDTSILLSIMLLGLAPAFLDFYSQTHLFYKSPKKYLLVWGIYLAASVGFSLAAPDIGAATVLMVGALFIKAILGWMVAGADALTL